MQVAVVGAGYVGLNCGVAFAYLGHSVRVVEKSQTRLEQLSRWHSPIHEHGMEALLAMPSVRSRLSFTASMAEAIEGVEAIIIAVGTPARANGQANTRQVEEAAAEMADAVPAGQPVTVVVKSTVPVGMNRRVAAILERRLAARGIENHLAVASNPEFLREGKALADMLYPDRIVVGSESAQAVDAMHRLYRPILEQSFDPPELLDRPQAYHLPHLIVTSPASAEMIKYASNAFLAAKVSFINEVAGLCERVDADVAEVARGMGLDNRIGPGFLSAGLGWGGSCFPKDTHALLSMAADHDYTMPIIQAAIDVNRRQRQVVVDKLQTALKGLRGRTVGVLGLSFKPGTDDVRDAPSIDIIRMLLERDAYVQVHDPVSIPSFRRDYPDLDVRCGASVQDAAEGVDALVVTTEWPEYRSLDWPALAAVMRGCVVVDARNCLDVAEATRAGMVVLRIGQ